MRISRSKLNELEKAINAKIHALQIEVVIATMSEVVEDDPKKLILVVRVSDDI